MCGPLVFKIPRIRLIRFLVSFFFTFRDQSLAFRWNVCSDSLFEGLRENFREAVSIRCHHRLFARLLFPLVILNVFRREDGVGKIDTLLFERHAKETDPDLVSQLQECLHTFDNPDNFALDLNGPKILDYGEYGLVKIISQHGDRIEKILRSLPLVD